MTYCNERTISRGNAQEQEAISLRCRSWTCEECAVDRRRRLIAEAIAGGPTTFITLTSRRREGMTPTQAAKELANGWRRARRIIMRLNKWKTLPFLAVFERTKLGWPHLHIVARCGWIEQRQLSALMDRFCNSPVVSIEKIKKAKKIANYVAKYIAQEPFKFEGTKRYWRSMDFIIEPLDKPQDGKPIITRWDRQEMSFDKWVEMWTANDWEVTVRRGRYAHAKRPLQL